MIYLDAARHREVVVLDGKIVFSISLEVPEAVRQVLYRRFWARWLHETLGAPLGDRPADLSKVTPENVRKLVRAVNGAAR